MFEILAGTACRAIRADQNWRSPNFRCYTSTRPYLFDKEEMRVDPTGIAVSWCAVPGGRTVGSAYAAAGWYGFLRDGWYCLVPANAVKYIG